MLLILIQHLPADDWDEKPHLPQFLCDLLACGGMFLISCQKYMPGTKTPVISSIPNLSKYIAHSYINTGAMLTFWNSLEIYPSVCLPGCLLANLHVAGWLTPFVRHLPVCVSACLSSVHLCVSVCLIWSDL